jgi:hypothetical protein
MERIFKLEIEAVSPVYRIVTRRFNSLKTMRQWLERNDLDNSLACLGYKEYILNGENWERFTIIGKRLVPFSELVKIVNELQK